MFAWVRASQMVLKPQSGLTALHFAAGAPSAAAEGGSQIGQLLLQHPHDHAQWVRCESVEAMTAKLKKLVCGAGSVPALQ